MQQEEPNTIIQTDVSKYSVVKSLIWKFLERGGTQGIQFVIQIVLARLLCPEDYGIIAILTAFIALANVFVQSGFNTALIQKKDADELDFSSVFWLSLFVAALLYILLFFTAPFIAGFYRKSILTPVLRVLALTLFFGALNSVQSAMVSKTMQFKRFFFSSMGGVAGSGIIGIIFAYKGLGVWALVAQQLVNGFLISVILWFTVKWRPCLMFSFKRLKSLFSFGWKLLCSGLLDTGYNQIYNLVIGRVFTSSDLGLFNRGETFSSTVANSLDGSIQSVMLPAISAHNDKPEDVKRLTRRSISTSAFILMPFMFGMAAVAKSMVQVLLTDKWIACVPYLQLACFAYALYPLHTANLTAINAMGRSDIFLKLELIKKGIGILFLVLSIPLGLIWMAIGRVISGVICTFVNAYPNKKLLNYSYFEQLKDILPSLLLALFMGICVYCIGYLPLKPVILLLLQIIAGICIYAGFAKLLKFEEYEYFISTIKSFKNRG